MTDLLAAVAKSLSADIRRLDTISQNVANSATPGFRAQQPALDFGAQLSRANGVEGNPELARPGLDLRDGPLEQTGRGWDLALRGEGFFVALHDQSELLVRGGDFRVTADGALVTSSGDPVLGDDSAPLQVGAQPVRVDEHGTLFAGDQRLGALKLIAAPAQSLRARAGGYRLEGGSSPFQGRVQQGVLERSNVDAADQTLRLLELTRHVESVQRAVSIYDKAMDTGINQLGER